ncbi:MAG TPA: ABC transporter ATP-binding protein [Rectinemataceae bacterium]|nr:ABC transporter ATP-binding protein [Rectinemataceae bacterium]
MPDSANEPILDIRDLSIIYPISIGTVHAVQDVTLSLYKGEVLGIVGESGCGKSTLGLSILKLMKPPGRISSGSILYKGTDILGMDDRALLDMRGRNIAMIFQNPLTSLDPLMSVERHFIEAIQVHEPHTGVAECIERAKKILSDLGIEGNRLKEYPYQLSGGMRQRIMIGLALILHPDILLADEPTTALDVIVEAGFTELLIRLHELYSLTVVLISHNLGLVAQMADRIAVMYGGRLVELATVNQIFEKPLHPYTQGLMNCVPNILLEQKELNAMPGSPPDLVGEPKSCPFAPRCPKAMDICRSRVPPLKDYGGRQTACWLYEGGV